jgi:ribonuclease HII
LLYYERKLKKQGYDLIIGVDEAGRGPLAGPVVAAAVALKDSSFNSRIDDSKKLTPLIRQKAFPEIIQKSFFGVGIISEKTIDQVNILAATQMAMQKAVASLARKISPDKLSRAYIIVDGDMRLKLDIPYTSIIKGDTKSKSIACASILAKVIRDQIMELYDSFYPEYNFKKHKGYPTKEHYRLLKKAGPSEAHRKSFLN